MCIETEHKLGKRQMIKKAIKDSLSWVKKLPGKAGNFAKSRFSKRNESKLRLSRMFPVLCFGVLFQPKPSLAFELGDLGGTLSGLGDFGQNATIIGGSYKLTRELVSNGVRSIPDPSLRTAVSSVGSVAALVGGTACGIGTAICTGMGWKGKAMVCFHGTAICTGAATGLSQADPANPVTLPGRVAGEVFEKTTESLSA